MTELMWSILRIVVASYIGVALIVILRQSSYVYYPDKQVIITPAYFKIGFEEVTLTTADKETIAAWYVPAPSEVPGSAQGLRGLTLLFCHGNAGDIGDRIDSIKTFHEMGLNTFIFDYRGYGDSTGKPTEQGTYLDAMAAWEYLTKTRSVAPRDIIVFGRSLGGGVASQLAEKVHPGALVLESSFTSAQDMAFKMFPYLPIRLFCRFKYNSIDRVGKADCPVLIANSADDRTIPFEHGQRLYDACLEPKCFVEMSGDHNVGSLDADKEYQQTFVEFLGTHLNKTEKSTKDGES
jgi:fermentation-respiration switch protein FrsA (DUF1100 family)